MDTADTEEEFLTGGLTLTTAVYEFKSGYGGEKVPKELQIFRSRWKGKILREASDFLVQDTA
ncbi:hypothetical protein IFR04_016355, partial [Cadophora malorum]